MTNEEIPYVRSSLVEILVYHYRKNDSSCGCGWAELGHSHPEHVVNVYEMSVGVKEEREGVWIIYGWDTMPYPLFIEKDELKARQYQNALGYYTFIKFWKFGDEFGTE